MASEQLKNVFLSASIPLKDRDPKYYGTADVIAIRDAVLALTTEVLPKHRLIWGGHPSITPLIYYVMQRLDLNIQEHVLLYQSRFFEKALPIDNASFNNVVLTNDTGERESSLLLMRKEMFHEHQFSAGVFIGGMDGIEEEFKLFKEYHPRALLLPISSTGAAAKMAYKDLLPFGMKDKRLEQDYAYMSVFQDLLMDKI